MTYKICIPYYKNINLLDNCLAGMDIDWRHILIVDNSPNSDAKKHEGKGAMILYYPENIGVAKSWNIGLKAACDWTFLVSINVAFPNGFSDILTELNNANEYVMLTNLAYHLVGISRKLVERIGYFDENFYPAYYEDTDYTYRRVLAGIDYKKVVDVSASTTRQANSLDAGLPVNFTGLADYYKEKWGGYPTEEKYTKPFNKYDSLAAWTSDTLATYKQRYGLK